MLHALSFHRPRLRRSIVVWLHHRHRKIYRKLFDFVHVSKEAQECLDDLIICESKCVKEITSKVQEKIFFKQK
nr:hypothetical protein Itr_chr15CG15460 [Ipomoea trifida]